MIGGATPSRGENCRYNEIYGGQKKPRLFSPPPRPFPCFSLSALLPLPSHRKILIPLQDGITRKNSSSGNRCRIISKSLNIFLVFRHLD